MSGSPPNRALVIGVATAIILVAVAAATDWRFWYRWFTLPEDAGEWPASYYQPTMTVPGSPRPFFPVAEPAARTIDIAALEAAADWAEQHNSAALIVMHKGVVQLERYWQGITADSLFTGRAMTRSLIPALVGIAMSEGAIKSLDDPAETYLTEWRGQPEGQITLRQLLQNVSGLENPAMGGDPNPYNRNNRLALGSDFRAAALRYELVQPPGSGFVLSNANAQLLGAVLESATGEGYEDYLNSRLWSPMGAGPAELYVDSPNGMPAVFCCFRATPHDWLRYGQVLLQDGQVGDQQIWPAGWVKEMTTPSAVYPNYAFQIWVGNPEGKVRPYTQGLSTGAPHGEAITDESVFFLEGGGYRTLYIMPDHDLVILRLGYSDPNWETSAIPNRVLAGIAAAE
ncbi:MAG: serine hydrolase [Gammaproteobacteria bacterium]|jgi:CubicO group peptidase (beta-lactamase class C family)|nr:serine hydrolase [Gammaproteobacteria bacterium]